MPPKLVLPVLALRRLAFLRSAPVRSAPVRSASLRSTLLRLALLRLALLRLGRIAGCCRRHAFHASTPCLSTATCSSLAIGQPHHLEWRHSISRGVVSH